LDENVACTLCYVAGFVTGIIFLVVDPYKQNRNIRFHAFQSILLCVAYLAFSIVLSIIVSMLLAAAPGALFAMVGLLHSLLHLVMFALWLFLLYKTYNKQKVVLPIIGPIAQKMA